MPLREDTLHHDIWRPWSTKSSNGPDYMLGPNKGFFPTILYIVFMILQHHIPLKVKSVVTVYTVSVRWDRILTEFCDHRYTSTSCWSVFESGHSRRTWIQHWKLVKLRIIKIQEVVSLYNLKVQLNSHHMQYFYSYTMFDYAVSVKYPASARLRSNWI